MPVDGDIQFPEEWNALDVVLCHDWLTGMRGGERVLEILCRAFPRAPIYTLIHNPSALSPDILAHPVHTSFLQHIPAILRKYRYFLPLFPAAVNTLRPPRADLVISTSHCVAKSLRPAPGSRHLCYCFTPMRYAWCLYDEYFGKNPLKATVAKPVLAALRRWDRATASRVNRFVAISRHVRERIRTAYGRESDVVYPPVNTARCTPSNPATAPQSSFDLIVSALVPYKRVDLAVAAYNRMGHPLLIVGTGTEFDRIRRMAAANVQLLGWQPDEHVLELYRSCRLLVFPGEEDFGIVPLEAQACGKPVVAFRRGGALETLREGTTGVFFDAQTPDALSAAVQTCARTTWNSAAIRRHAEDFGHQAFIDGLAESIRQCLAP
jgi:glycosyltransferase involved in cell wall biosynthesis